MDARDVTGRAAELIADGSWETIGPSFLSHTRFGRWQAARDLVEGNDHAELTLAAVAASMGQADLATELCERRAEALPLSSTDAPGFARCMLALLSDLRVPRADELTTWALPGVNAPELLFGAVCAAGDPWPQDGIHQGHYAIEALAYRAIAGADEQELGRLRGRIDALLVEDPEPARWRLRSALAALELGELGQVAGVLALARDTEQLAAAALVMSSADSTPTWRPVATDPVATTVTLLAASRQVKPLRRILEEQPSDALALRAAVLLAAAGSRPGQVHAALACAPGIEDADAIARLIAGTLDPVDATEACLRLSPLLKAGADTWTFLRVARNAEQRGNVDLATEVLALVPDPAHDERGLDEILVTAGCRGSVSVPAWVQRRSSSPREDRLNLLVGIADSEAAPELRAAADAIVAEGPPSMSLSGLREALELELGHFDGLRNWLDREDDITPGACLDLIRRAGRDLARQAAGEMDRRYAWLASWLQANRAGPAEWFVLAAAVLEGRVSGETLALAFRAADTGLSPGPEL